MNDRRIRLILRLRADGFKIKELTRLRIQDIVIPATTTIRSEVPVGKRSRQLSTATRQALLDYLNAPTSETPFTDYRPAIGEYLFPSWRTGKSLTREKMHKMLAKCNYTI
jgi:integrase